MYVILNNELYHHGIKGQKWGVRRFQNTDGSLKPAGEKRYGGSKREEKQARKREGINEYSKVIDSYNRDMKKSDEIWEQAKAEYKSLGPNRISRIKEVSKAHRGEGSAAAKKYLDLYDKSTKLADDAYDRKMEAQYRLGKSVVKAYNKETKRSERAAKKAEKKKNVLNTKIGGTDEGKKSLKQQINELDPKVKKAFTAATAVTFATAFATVALSKNAHKNDTTQRVKRTERKMSEVSKWMSKYGDWTKL